MALRVGILGAGQAGERHAVGFSNCHGAKLEAVADVDQKRASNLAERFDMTAFTDWRAMLKTDLDILVVSLPHNMHVAPAEAAAEQGINVLMEKPIATTLDDAKRIVDVCNEARVKLSISFVHRFREELQVAHHWLKKGYLGKPQIVRETMGGATRQAFVRVG